MKSEGRRKKEKGRNKISRRLPVGSKQFLRPNCLLPTAYCLLVLLTTHYPLSTALAQTLPSFFTERDLATLEQLVVIAQEHDLHLMEIQAELGIREQTLSFEGRLAQALSITAGSALTGDMYGQANLSYSASITLDVMKLLEAENTTTIIQQRINNAKFNTRLNVIEAFVNYKVALINAQTSARAVEASQANYEVTVSRVKAGESILSSQIRAQSDLANAGLNLYQANGTVIVALERLAANIGISPQETAEILNN